MKRCPLRGTDIIENFKNLIKKPYGRYLIVGGSVYIFELAIIFVAQALGANNLLAVGLSFWLGLIVSFALQKFITFRDRRRHRKVIVAQFLAVTVLVLWNFAFTLIVTKLLGKQVPAYISRTLALAVTTIWNFYLYKTRIFKNTGVELID